MSSLCDWRTKTVPSRFAREMSTAGLRRFPAGQKLEHGCSPSGNCGHQTLPVVSRSGSTEILSVLYVEFAVTGA